MKNSTPADDSVLDLEKLQSLDGVLPFAEVNAFVEMCLTDADARLAAIAGAAMDLTGVAHSAHVLVSTAGNVGAMAVSVSARRLEEACRNSDRAAVAGRIEELQTVGRAACDALRAWLAARTAPAAERA